MKMSYQESVLVPLEEFEKLTKGKPLRHHRNTMASSSAAATGNAKKPRTTENKFNIEYIAKQTPSSKIQAKRRKLLNFMKNRWTGNLTWDERTGEVIVRGTVIANSNINDILTYLQDEPLDFSFTGQVITDSIPNGTFLFIKEIYQPTKGKQLQEFPTSVKEGEVDTPITSRMIKEAGEMDEGAGQLSEHYNSLVREPVRELSSLGFNEHRLRTVFHEMWIDEVKSAQTHTVRSEVRKKEIEEDERLRKTEQAVVKTMLDEIADEERRIQAEKGNEYEKRLGIDKEQPTTTKTRRREYFKGLAKVNPRMYKKSQKDSKKIFEKALKKHKGDKTAARDEVLRYNEDRASTLHAIGRHRAGLGPSIEERMMKSALEEEDKDIMASIGNLFYGAEKSTTETDDDDNDEIIFNRMAAAAGTSKLRPVEEEEEEEEEEDILMKSALEDIDDSQ